MIEIKKYVKPDLVIVRSRGPTLSGYEKFSVVLSENVVVVENCDDEEGFKVNTWSRRYFACRLVNDTIEVCVPKLGWIEAYGEINNKYKNNIADNILLSGDKK